MNYNKFFLKAKNANIEASEIAFIKSSKINFSLFHGEIDNYSISNQSSIKVKGIYNNQFGNSSTEDISDNSIDYLISNIIKSASIVEKDEKPVIFKGSEKYHKKNVFNKELAEIPVDVKLAKLHELEDAAYKADPRICDVEVTYEEEDETYELCNSYGLSLKSRSNYCVYMISVVCKDGDQVKSGYKIFLDSDFNKFNPIELANKVVDETKAGLNGQSLDAGEYKCVISPEATSSFLSALINTGFSADNVQKKSSLLVGKLDQKVFNSKVTVEEKPLTKNCFFRYFDDEGVATNNKKLIDKGVVKTYLYNLETATKENKEPTGNGFNGSIRAINIELKPGKNSEDDIIATCNNGVYIKSVSGLHAGLNAQSGDFSLEAQGFLIKDGKIACPLKLITVGGNIYKVFNNVIAIANNSELRLNQVTTPSILVKGIKVSSL